ncbi:DUF551 domain-containing protein [Salmonella enterica]|mgnify:CR=1 FL=1|uniref:DUF551 domain-containing protein n=7 Tax=Salmonella TaxID=590 RepID=A0A3Z7QFP1_SALET|nr:Eaa protein [Salmonella enterica subsp. enterica serovar Choleraesuis str. SC-B67]AXQ03645.1 DUF551 domain-containing protein [Salmonella enterica subsp. enterica serovar Choleraesuis str. ATCC 10708]EAA9665262.1 DUF551 domain-containing protein [Salmonella enterica subsp. enterica serovar Infantis]EAC1092081.1 DUF551 domain-containing protein [Salmonella enterica subsp. enterica serovar Choleraesuis]EAO2818607.1 DUF551 domain-containing protein [Salmonella enterica]EAW2186245.1 DUF551 doma
MTITKERLLKIQHWREIYGAGSNVMLPTEEAAELARIALASLEAEPIGAFHIADQQVGGTSDYIKDGKWPIDNGVIEAYAAQPVSHVPETLPCPVHLVPGLRLGKGCKTETLLTVLQRRAEYYAKLEAMTPEEREKHGASIEAFKAMLPQPAPVDKEFIPKNLDKALGVVGVALPESKEEFNFQIERWIQRLIDRVIRYADEFKEQLVPVVPEEMNFSTACNFVQINGMAKEDRATLAMRAWNACRAAMLQGGEPVSQTYELPQTQFEQVADLYEMQFDDGRTCAFHTDGAKAAQWLLACDDNKVQEYVRIERYQEAVIGNSPVSPGSWISCSERMPDNDESKPIAIFTGKCLGQGMFVATYDDDGFFDYWEGMEIIGVTHWMPLPAAPQQ